MKREMLRPQHFHNKSLVVSCYWFKFEPNTKIIFCPNNNNLPLKICGENIVNVLKKKEEHISKIQL